jgi:hypothetical protein
MGRDPVGLLIYGADGRMSVQISAGTRGPFASGDPTKPTPAEAIESARRFFAYFGSFTVDEANQAVTHEITASTFPNWDGAVQRRFYELHGNRLQLSTPPLAFGAEAGVSTLVWERPGPE